MKRTKNDDNKLIAKAIKKLLSPKKPFEIPKHLGLLKKFRRNYSSRDTFSNTDVVFIQHHLGPLVPRLEAMKRAGLNPKRCWFVDIPYSTSPVVRRELSKRGFKRAKALQPLDDPMEPYDRAQEKRAHQVFRKVAGRKNPNPLLVIDDGAYFARFLVHSLRHEPQLARKFVGTRLVEQTTRGHRYLQEEANNTIKLFELSVVSIARSATKLNFEAPFIGAAVANAAVDAAKNAPTVQKEGDEKRLTVAVIGYGAIGKATVNQLVTEKIGQHLHIVDTHPAARSAATERLCKANNKAPIVPSDPDKPPVCSVHATLHPDTKYDLVIGCTGRGSFTPDDRKRLADKALLVSGSSASIEFNRLQFFQLCALDPKVNGYPSFAEGSPTGIHSTLTFEHEPEPAKQETFSFANAGFPINFDGEIEHLPTAAIQATHCLLYGAAQQARHSTEVGFHPLALETDLWIHRNALRLLRRKLRRHKKKS
ncbi:MAG: hypothetical protein HKN10_20915 [Myxococcales bacterium]|nr:hypothetical protein [Myxococcales bacterium]